MSDELQDKAWITGTPMTWKSDAVLVEIFADKGILGIGESANLATSAEGGSHERGSYFLTDNPQRKLLIWPA